MKAHDKDNQEGGINQCFYFDKTFNNRLYIQFQIFLGPGPDWNGPLRQPTPPKWLCMADSSNGCDGGNGMLE